MSNFMGVGIFWIGLNRADLGCWRLTLRQSIKIKDDKIESLNNKVKELEKKLKSDSNKLSDMKQSRDSFRNLSEIL